MWNRCEIRGKNGIEQSSNRRRQTKYAEDEMPVLREPSFGRIGCEAAESERTETADFGGESRLRSGMPEVQKRARLIHQNLTRAPGGKRRSGCRVHRSINHPPG